MTKRQFTNRKNLCPGRGVSSDISPKAFCSAGLPDGARGRSGRSARSRLLDPIARILGAMAVTGKADRCSSALAIGSWCR